jgi:tRNA A-37 threonylcarbamoyl transferase component Bud32
MNTTSRFCYGCNEKVAVRPEQPQCPHCGETLAEVTLAPTVDLQDVGAWQTHAEAVEPHQSREDELVGASLATYEIEALVGKGGMARVYRARHATLYRLCAVKVLNPELIARRPDFVDEFLGEARAAAALVHPHVVTIHTIGQAEGLHYIEMEYIVGRSLRWLVETKGLPDPVRATDLMMQACSALAAAHRQGIVHRDVKPGNILITAEGVAKLADFGLAKRVVSDKDEIRERGLVGTPYFMAPELFAGEPAGTSSDVYALGVTYFYLLCGRLPYVDRSVTAVAHKHAEEAIPELERPEVPPEVLDVLRHSLAKRPAQRYPDGAAFYEELRAVYGNVRSTESLVREALDGLDLEWEGDGERFVATVPLHDGRHQRVIIEATRGPRLAERLVKIYSVCAPRCEEYYRRALELNAEMPHGAIALENIHGRPHFVMANTYPRATCDPEEIRRSVLAIAQHADEVEQMLTGEDQN